MTTKHGKHCSAIHAVTLVILLLACTGLRAQEGATASETISEKTKEFLSDPARTGSLLGTILIGAAIPNPLSPILGSVAGFLIGKSSAFSKNDSDAARREAFSNRTLIPDGGLPVTSLAGLTGNAPQGSDETSILGLSGATWTADQPGNTEQASALELSLNAGTAGQPVSTEQASALELSQVAGTGNQLGEIDQVSIMAVAGDAGMGNHSVRTEQASALELSQDAGTGNQPGETEQVSIMAVAGDAGTGRQLQHNEPPVFLGIISETGAGNQTEQPARVVIVESSEGYGPGSNVREQLAYACDNAQNMRSLPLGCYYYSQ